MLAQLRKLNTIITSTLQYKSHRYFAKQAPAKGGKKEQPKPVVAVIEEQTAESIISRWVANAHPSLSPSQQLLYTQGFQDLQPLDKQILNDFAQKILFLQTAIFYDCVQKKGILGTSELLFTAVDAIPQSELEQKVLHLRKQI